MHTWFKDCIRSIATVAGLKSFESPTLMRLLDTKDERVAAAAARELSSRIVARFDYERTFVDDVFEQQRLRWLGNDRRIRLFAEIKVHAQKLEEAELAQFIKLVPLSTEGIGLQQTLLSEVLRRLRTGDAKFGPKALCDMLVAGHSSLEDISTNLGLWLICTYPTSADVQRAIDASCPRLKQTLFSLVRRIERAGTQADIVLSKLPH